MNASEVRDLVDDQLRRRSGEQAGRVVRNDRFGVEYSALTAEDADAAIAEQIAYFRGVGRRFEWKHYGHDTPADLPARLLAAGLVPEPPEALMVAEIGPLRQALGDARLPAGVSLVPVDDPAGFDAIVGLHQAVWGRDYGDMGRDLADEQAADPDAIRIFRAVDGGRTVCAAWVRFHAGTDFASLWGGSTLPEWRRRGIYRALVAHRAALAAERGFRYLQVDASDDSRPILGRLGFVVLTTTTPYVWSPPAP